MRFSTYTLSSPKDDDSTVSVNTPEVVSHLPRHRMLSHTVAEVSTSTKSPILCGTTMSRATTLLFKAAPSISNKPVI